MKNKQIPASCGEQPERIELRSADGPLLGVLLLSPLRLEVKRGKRVFEVDLAQTVRAKEAVILERFHTCSLHVAEES